MCDYLVTIFFQNIAFYGKFFILFIHFLGPKDVSLSQPEKAQEQLFFENGQEVKKIPISIDGETLWADPINEQDQSTLMLDLDFNKTEVIEGPHSIILTNAVEEGVESGSSDENKKPSNFSNATEDLTHFTNLKTKAAKKAFKNPVQPNHFSNAAEDIAHFTNLKTKAANKVFKNPLDKRVKIKNKNIGLRKSTNQPHDLRILDESINKRYVTKNKYQCKECNFESYNRSELFKHFKEKKHFKQKDDSIEILEESINKRYRMRDKYFCKKCDFGSFVAAESIEHALTHLPKDAEDNEIAPNSFRLKKCQICSSQFTNESALNEHIKTKHNLIEVSKEPEVKVEPETPKPEAEPIDAMDINSEDMNKKDEPYYECSICKKSKPNNLLDKFAKIEELRIHLVSTHFRDLLLKQLKDQLSKFPICPAENCQAMFNQVQFVKEHFEFAHKNQNLDVSKMILKCQNCYQGPFANENGLLNHLAVKHGSDVEEFAKKIRVELSFTPINPKNSLQVKKLPSTALKKKVVRISTTPGNETKTSFLDDQDMTKHKTSTPISKKTPATPFKRPTGPPNAGGPKIPQKAGVDIYKFRNSNNYVHVVPSTMKLAPTGSVKDLKPVEQSYLKNFSIKDLIGEGIISYVGVQKTNEKFNCELCNKTFYVSKALQQHLTFVHGNKVKKFQCKKCDQNFVKNVDLQVHISAVHGGPKKFKCDICQKDFASQLYLKNHKALVHENLKNPNSVRYVRY